MFKYIAETKEKFKAQNIEDVSFPRGINGLEKYGRRDSVFTKGTPFHTKGALMYNHLLDKKGLANRYPKIKNGEKMKFFYMREPNPTGVNAMAFLTKYPTEFGLDQYIDWEMQWEKSFIEPLKLILNAIKWDTQRRANLDDLFDWDDDDAPVSSIGEDVSDDVHDEAQYLSTGEDDDETPPWD